MGDVGEEKGAKSHVARDILDRLQKLEDSQNEMIAEMKKSHAEEMEQLRSRLETANILKRQALERPSQELVPNPVLVSYHKTEIEAAVQAASVAAQRSSEAVEEVRKVAESARLASGGIPQSAIAATKDGSVGYGPDGDYLVKRVNVNLDDVERVINSSDLVEVCRAFGRPDSRYGNEVYCAVVPKRNTRVSEPMMMTYAQKYLPAAFVPRRFFFLEDLPSGITRKALADTQEIKELSKKPLPRIENTNAPPIEN